MRATRPVLLLIWMLAAVLAAGPAAFAQGPPGKRKGPRAKVAKGEEELGVDLGDIDRELKIKDIVHSATKTTTTVEEAPAVIHIVTAEDIAQFGHRNLLDVLLYVPGFLETHGQYDVTPAFSVLGVIQGVLYMRDGVSMFDPLYNVPAMMRRIPLETIKRIEAMTSPGGVLWGANSFLGIINVMTKDPEDVKGVEMGIGGGHGPGDEMVIRPWVMYGDTFLKGRLGALVHLSVEWFKGPKYRMPEVWYFRPGAELSGPAFFRDPGGVDTLLPVSAYTTFDGKLVYKKPGTGQNLTLGWQISLPKLPNLILSAKEKRMVWWDGIHRPLGFYGMPMRSDADLAVLRNNRINWHDSYAYLRYQDKWASDRVGLDSRAYYARFDRQFDPFINLPLTERVLQGVGERVPAVGHRAGATLDLSVKAAKFLHVLFGGEVFYEWVRDADVFFVAPLDESGQVDLSQVNLFGCPYDNVHGDNIPVYDPRNPENTTYRPGCRSPFVFDSDRLVYAAYLSAQLRPHRTLILDGGVRLQHGPWGSVPYKRHFLYSGAAVWNFYRDLFLKVNYATGFRPPVFNSTSGSGPGGNYGGDPDIRTEESRAVKAELNTKVLKNRKQIRQWSVRVNYSYTTLYNMIRLVSGRYHNSTEKALHAVEFISDLYLKGGHRFALSYTYVRQHGSSYLDGGVFRAVPNHWATAAASFNLLTRKNLRLDMNLAARFIGPFEDPNRLLICPGGGNECTARSSDIVWDRLPPAAILNAGLRLRVRAGRKPVEFTANFYNILDANYWTTDAFQDLKANVEMQPGPGQRFYFFLEAKVKL